MTRLLIVGGNAAGMSAASKAKRMDPELEVLVLEAGQAISYSACGIPYQMEGLVESPEDLLVLTPEKAAARGIDVRLGHRATKLEPDSKTLHVQTPEGLESFAYDRLLIATGTRPRIPFAGGDLPGVHTLRHVWDGEALLADLEGGCECVAILGAGFIALESAEALAKRGKTVKLLHRSDKLLGVMDADMTDNIVETLEGLGVEVVLHAGIDRLEQEGDQIRLHGAKTHHADAVLIATGVGPVTGWLHDAGIRMDARGYIHVNERQETNLPDVWAAGDCCTVKDILSGQAHPLALALPANRMGRIAGENMAGGSAAFPGVLGTSVLRLGDQFWAQTGMTETYLAKTGMPFHVQVINAHHKAGYMPGDGRVRVKLLCDPDGDLLGCQIRGPAEGALRIQAAAVAVQHGVKVQQLAETETAYAPPVSPVTDPLVVCAMQLAKQLD